MTGYRVDSSAGGINPTPSRLSHRPREYVEADRDARRSRADDDTAAIGLGIETG
jgi:hypothetical protein